MRTGILLLMTLSLLLVSVLASQSAETVKISRDDTALDLTATTDVHTQRGEAIQVSTAPDAT
ncbi:MAG: hypothetical protein AAGC96_15690, partial [Pseudomonadota bacterium]